MRYLSYICLSLAVFGAAQRAEALSCLGPSWSGAYKGPLYDDQIVVPVDAQPWRVEYCGSSAPATLSDCALVDAASDERIAVTTRTRGAEACGVLYQDRPSYGTGEFIRTFTPEQPLVAGHVYALRCDDITESLLRVREDAVLAAPPSALELRGLHRNREDEGCCGPEDNIEFRVGDAMAAYLREGGYIEANYDDSQHFALVIARGDADDRLEVPTTRGKIALTPVSAAGVRGETVEVDGSEIDGDLVYIPCTIAGRSAPAALWLLAPFVWIAGHGRRRRRSV